MNIKKILFLFLVICTYSSLQATKYFVTPEGSDTNDGFSWSTPKTLNGILTNPALVADDEIFVKKGTYTTPASQSFICNVAAVKVYGNCLGCETEKPVYNVDNIETFLVGNGKRVLYFNTASTFSGFDISGGDAALETIPTPTTNSAGRGGGVYVDNIGGKIEYCIVRNCFGAGATSTVKGIGGGVYTYGDVDHCIVKDNVANANATLQGIGGGIYILSGKITHSTIKSNACLTVSTGGGSTGGNRGGGIACVAGSIVNCLIVNNSIGGKTNSANYGGGIDHSTASGNVLVINCTIVNNNAFSGRGGGVGGANNSKLQLANCILTDNITGTATAPAGNNIYIGTGSSTYQYSLWPQAAAITTVFTNITTDPLFVDKANGNYTLQSTSPAKNTGNNTPIQTYSIDLAGKNRIQGTTVDMGAYEYEYIAQIITFSPITAKTYGDAAFDLYATGGGSGNAVTYTSSNTGVATVSGSTVTIVGQGSTNITASQAGNSTYSAATNVIQQLTVNAKPITLTNASAISKVYDGTNAAVVTGTLSGIINSDDVTCTTGTFLSSNVGNLIAVSCVLSGAKASNYTLTQPGISANITSATLNLNSVTNEATSYAVQQLANSDIVVSWGEFVFNQPTTTVQSVTVSPGAKLSLGSNTLIATNGITLLSDENGTATFMDNYSSPTVNATVKQYVESGRNWYVSSPISTGNTSSLSRGDSVVQYNEQLKKWEKVTGSLVPGRGYIQTAIAGHGSTGYVDFSGLTNSGIITAPTLTRTAGASAGFNLVGNPYPSYLDWGEVATANPKVLPTAYFRTKKTTEAGGGYTFATVNVENPASPQIVTNDASTTITKFIPPMQAFWVRVDPLNIEVTDFTFSNANREHFDVLTPGNKFKVPKVSTVPSLRLKLYAGTVSDEALIYINNNASNGFDRYDSPKMFASAATSPELYTKAGTEKVVINGLNEVAANQEVTLGFNYGQAGELKLKATEITNFDNNIRVYLYDKTDNKEIELLPDVEYVFKTSTVATNNESRFSLLFRAPGVATGVINTAKKMNVQVFVNATNQITIIAPENIAYCIFNTIGQKQYESVLNVTKTTITKAFSSGAYFVQLTANGKSEIQKVIIR